MTDPRLYVANHKQYDHTGYVVPEVEHSESQYPHGGFKPAAWLPVGRYDKKLEAYVVCAPGKPVAVDRQGRVVPAGWKTTFEAASGSTVLTYTATDVTEHTVDLTTGVAVTAATSYTQNQVTTALKALGLIRSTEYAEDFVSEPIGYAPYTYWAWCGGNGWNPTLYKQHNFNLQHGVAVGCDKVLKVPMVPTTATAELMGSGSTGLVSTAITFGTSGVAAWHNATGIHATTKYADLVAVGDSVIAYVFDNYPVAKITTSTPITDSAGTLAGKTEVDSIAKVKNGGSDYFYIDYDSGVLFLYETNGDAMADGFTDSVTTITYYHYQTAATGSAEMVQVLGDLQPGDFVTFDDNSNYIKMTYDIGTCSGNSGTVYAGDPDYPGGTASTISAQLEAWMEQCLARPLGQVIAVEVWPKSGLDKVMTQFNAFTAYERMPGTATAGMSDALVQAGGANKMAIINFFRR